MALALFDLDNTLLNGDSDHSWGIFLGEIGVVDPKEQANKQDYYYQQYKKGELDILEFLEFQLQALADNSLEQLEGWRQRFINEVITKMIATGKAELLEPHKSAGDKIIIITATNDFITRPIADLLGVDTLIATKAEIRNKKYTGRCEGTPCFQAGKITRLKEWLSSNPYSLDGSFFYSDSINDLPLLEKVDTPIAVTPDESLRQVALKRNWKIID